MRTIRLAPPSQYNVPCFLMLACLMILCLVMNLSVFVDWIILVLKRKVARYKLFIFLILHLFGFVLNLNLI